MQHALRILSGAAYPASHEIKERASYSNKEKCKKAKELKFVTSKIKQSDKSEHLLLFVNSQHS